MVPAKRQKRQAHVDSPSPQRSSRDIQLVTETGGYVDVNKKEQIFLQSQSKDKKPKWRLFELMKPGKEKGKVCVAFKCLKIKNREKYLVVKDGGVKLEYVDDFVNKEECLFQWCKQNGDVASLQCVANQRRYLGKDEKNLLILSTQPAMFRMFSNEVKVKWIVEEDRADNLKGALVLNCVDLGCIRFSFLFLTTFP